MRKELKEGRERGRKERGGRQEGAGQRREGGHTGTGRILRIRAQADATPKPGQRERGLVTPKDEQGVDSRAGLQAVLRPQKSHTLSCASQSPHFPHTCPFSYTGPVKTTETPLVL